MEEGESEGKRGKGAWGYDRLGKEEKVGKEIKGGKRSGIWQDFYNAK